MSECHAVVMLLAARAFDALEPAERELVDEHLRACPDCRAAYARLTALPDLLDLAGPDEVEVETPPALLEASVLAALPDTDRSGPRQRAQRRRGWRARPTIAVAALGLLLVALAAIGLSGALRGGGGDGPSLALIASPQGGNATAVVHLRPHPWGTEVDLEAEDLTPTHGSQIYEVWFVSPRGRVSAGTFKVGASGHVIVQLAAGARLGRYESIGITREPDDNSPTRRGPNVLRASLPA